MERKVIIDGIETDYLISDEGVVKNTKTGKTSIGWLEKEGYRRFGFIVDGKRKHKLVHRIVAETFIPNPNNYLIVNHKDGNKQNNNVNNLEWCTQQTNVQHAVDNNLRKKDKVTIEKYTEDLPNEIWKPYFNNYMISNQGRCRNIKTNNLLKGSLRGPYLRYQLIDQNNNRVTLSAHVIVFELFGDEPLKENYVINHKDGNSLNNSIENLEQVTQQDNVIKSYYETNNRKIKKVGKYDLDNNLLGTYANTMDAARNNPGTHQTKIWDCCNDKYYQHHGFRWHYIEE